MSEMHAEPRPDKGHAAARGAASRRVRLGLGLAVALAVLALLLAGRSVAGVVPAFARWVAAIGPAGPIVFVLGYASASVALVPASLFTLASGAIFGLAAGVVWSFLAALLGSAVAFLLARHGARRFVERRIERDPRFGAIDRAIGEQGARIVFLLRLSPAFPFVLLNYALGLTRIGFRDYLLASVGMLPATFLYVYYGTVVGEVAAVASGSGVPHGRAYYATLGLGLLATIAVTTLVTRIARRALREATGA